MIKKIDKSNPDYSLIDTLNEIIDVLNTLEKNQPVIMNITNTPYNGTTVTCTCGLNSFYCPIHSPYNIDLT